MNCCCQTGRPDSDNEGHGFGKRDNRDYLTAVEMLFLQQHLLGTEKE